MIVRDVYKKFSSEQDTVRPNTPIAEVIDIFMKDRERRNVYIIDDSEKLIGMITVNEIFNSVRPNVHPNKILFFLENNNVKTADDIMFEPEIVKLDDDLEDALRVAKVSKNPDVHVCENGRLIGELDAFELVYGLMKSKK